MPNALSQSTSPYLLQHADNPVDWLPWGEPAFALARSTDRPILLSVGYSACHWCHVMAHESFENKAIAELMNAHFVPVKVDREERPDVDAIYMEAVQAMTGQGGWPLTVFLTPEGEPFYGGTYFPPVPRHGMASFPQLLEGIAAAWRDRRSEVLESSGRLADAMRQAFAEPQDAQRPGEPELLAARDALLALVDAEHGGFGRAPKFPQAPALSFLLDRALRDSDGAAGAAVLGALDGMARGGLWDHLGGGFHRYCVDASWSVPHFEKMLYDNALLARLYLEAGALAQARREAPRDAPERLAEPVDPAWGEDCQRAMALATSAYVLRELRAPGPEAAFLASQDADTSEGEGSYFVWTRGQLETRLEEPERSAALIWFGIRPGGNFEGGASVLSTRRSPGEVAGELGLSEMALRGYLESARRRLLEARAEREAPATDGKVIAAWNGLMIDALARQAGATEGPSSDRLYQSAASAARFVLDRMRLGNGLARSWKDDRVGVPGFLDDHAAIAGACLSLYEARFELRWFERAQQLAESIIEQFADAEGGGYYRTGPRNEQLLLRQKPLDDGALPGGNSLAADLFMRLHGLTGHSGYADLVEGALRAAAPVMRRAPMAAGAILRVLSTWRVGQHEVAVIGPLDRGARELLAELRAYRPGTVRAWAAEAGSPEAEAIPLLAGRGLVDGRAAAYVCRGQVCARPVTRAMELRAILDGRG